MRVHVLVGDNKELRYFLKKMQSYGTVVYYDVISGDRMIGEFMEY